VLGVETRRSSATIARSPSTIALIMSITLRKFMCVVCGYIYDEALGIPEEGIEPGTRFEDIPDAWTCPDCGATKADFELVETD
jgi:rubredoxin